MAGHGGDRHAPACHHFPGNVSPDDHHWCFVRGPVYVIPVSSLPSFPVGSESGNTRRRGWSQSRVSGGREQKSRIKTNPKAKISTGQHKKASRRHSDTAFVFPSTSVLVQRQQVSEDAARESVVAKYRCFCRPWHYQGITKSPEGRFRSHKTVIGVAAGMSSGFFFHGVCTFNGL